MKPCTIGWNRLWKKKKNLKMQTVLKLPEQFLVKLKSNSTCFHNTLNNDDY